MKRRLTTSHVAELLDVSEATVKRWADAGAIHFDKTAGGHRRFDIAAISRFQRERLQSTPAGPNPASKKGRGQKQKDPFAGFAFRDSLLHGKDQEASLALIGAYLRGRGLAELFDTAITDAMHSIGDLWFREEITISDEHLATQVILGAVSQLRNALAPPTSTGLRSICCGVESDLHELPTHLAATLLESRGWKATNLGPNTPIYSLSELISMPGRHDFKETDLICISARIIIDLERTAREIAELHRIGTRIGARILLGGEAFRDPSIRKKFPADRHASSFAELEEFAEIVEAEEQKTR